MVPTPQIAVIGGAAGGLAAAIDLAARRCAASPCWSARPRRRRQIAPVHAGAAGIDAGPTVLDHALGVRRAVRRRRHSLASHLTLHPADMLARHAWNETERLDLFADPERSPTRSAPSPARPKPRGFAPSAPGRSGLPHAGRPFIRAAPSDRAVARRRPGACRDLRGISPFTTLWKALGEHFHDPRLRQLFGRYATYSGSSPFAAPATLMLIAHVEQQASGCRTAAWALAEALAASHARWGAVGLAHTGGRDRWSRRPRHRRRPAERRTSRCRRGRLQCRCAALAIGRFGPALPGRRHAEARSGQLAVGGDLVPVGAHRRVPADRGTTSFLSRDYKAEFDDIFRRGRLPAEPTVYVCAQDRDETGRHSEGSPRAADPRQCAADRRPAVIYTAGDRYMRNADLQPAGTLRPDGAAANRRRRW